LLYNDPLLCGFNVPIKGLKQHRSAFNTTGTVSANRQNTDYRSRRVSDDTLHKCPIQHQSHPRSAQWGSDGHGATLAPSMIPHPVQIRLLPERQRKLANLLHACIWDAVTPICWDSSRRLRSTDTTDYVVWRTRTKIAVLVFQCLTGQAPGNLAEDCQLVADVSVRRLRSADTRPVSRVARPTSSATDASQPPIHGHGTRCQSI